MGAKLLTISLGSLVLIWFIDFFMAWYGKFLTRWMPILKIRKLLGHLVWAFLAVLFWSILYYNHLPETFTMTYFFFVLFIYSVHGLVESFVKSRSQEAAE